MDAIDEWLSIDGEKCSNSRSSSKRSQHEKVDPMFGATLALRFA